MKKSVIYLCLVLVGVIVLAGFLSNFTGEITGRDIGADQRNQVKGGDVWGLRSGGLSGIDSGDVDSPGATGVSDAVQLKVGASTLVEMKKGGSIKVTSTMDKKRNELF